MVDRGSHLVQRSSLDAGGDAAHGPVVFIDALPLGSLTRDAIIHLHSLLAICFPRHQVRQVRLICQTPCVRLHMSRCLNRLPNILIAACMTLETKIKPSMGNSTPSMLLGLQFGLQA